MKKDRQAAIIKFFEDHAAGTQKELLDYLLDAGFKATQATVSRDVKELRIVKRPTATGEYKYALPPPDADISGAQYMTILSGAVISTDEAANIVVIKCHAGTAQAACVALDTMGLSGTAGTLAGDDTIFILCYSAEDAHKTRKKLNAVLDL